MIKQEVLKDVGFEQFSDVKYVNYWDETYKVNFTKDLELLK